MGCVALILLGVGVAVLRGQRGACPACEEKIGTFARCKAVSRSVAQMDFRTAECRRDSSLHLRYAGRNCCNVVTVLAVWVCAFFGIGDADPSSAYFGCQFPRRRSKPDVLGKVFVSLRGCVGVLATVSGQDHSCSYSFVLTRRCWT